MPRRALLSAMLGAVFFVSAFSRVDCVRADTYGDLRIVNVQRAFGEVVQDVEDSIVNRGLVIDYRGYIGKMLARTGEAAGSAKPLYRDAQFFQFCSAIYSRRMMEADPRNIGYCPFVIVVYELAAKPGTVYVGYRRPAQAGSPASRKRLASVDKLLDTIVREVTE